MLIDVLEAVEIQETQGRRPPHWSASAVASAVIVASSAREGRPVRKSWLIGKVIADACDRVKNLDEGKYFEILKSMAEKYLLPREGEICFSKKDLERMPANFREEIKGLAQKKGGTLEISGEARNIDGGFILVYGGIEENCSIDAMFAEKRDELLDQVRKILFA